MDDIEIVMLLATVIGALAGVFYTTILNPIENYFYFMVLFAIVGAGIANVVLLVLVKIYRWLRV